MKIFITWFALLAAVWLPPSSSLAAETTNAAVVPAEPRAPAKIIRFGSNVRLAENQTSGDVVVISGNAVVRGHVQGSVVVLHGKLELDGTVESNIVVAAGSAVLGPKAKVNGGIVRVSAGLKIDPAAKVEGTVTEFSGWQVDWLAQGLFRGRPFPPQVPMLWLLASLFLLIHLVVAGLFRRSTLAVLETLEQRPVASFCVGLLTVLLLGPMVAMLAISRAGVPAIPVALSAVVAASVFGNIAVYCFSGQRVGRMTGWTFLQQPLAALVAGSVVFYLLYMMPWSGFMVLHLVSVIGLGAAVLATLRGLRRETARVSPETVPVCAASLLPPVADPVLWPHVGFWRRLGASLLDCCLLIIVLVPLKKIWLLVWLAYHIILWAKKGTTVGGMVMRLQIVREDGRPLTWGVALVRAVAGIFSALVLFLGFFWAGWSREKRAWHDRMAGTIVVQVPKGRPMV